ncbi:MAG: tRNA uridine-5-carboxymethylaminomethyl(34) synthesis enzyme MnmG [Bacteroidales bacterium]|nr:tRNA uridine-5-carboxymethylaminomethyl(34) synthesis enzyme MnmG [Bacteroidales bacterium]
MIFGSYDIIVVGAGHAGAEAAAAAANLGMNTLLITQNLDTICQMSCNPAMGGVAKGQIVREIDALGGFSGIVTDNTMIQFRMLNLSKGPAMWSPRAQCDKMRFSHFWRKILENTHNLSLWQDEVVAVTTENCCVTGVETKLGLTMLAKAVILTNGTFLNGRVYIGETTFSAGRIGEQPAVGLSDQLKNLGFEVEKLKTGTPVRVDGRTIDFSVLTEQKGDEKVGKFSFNDTPRLTEQKSCFLAYTSEKTHDILRTGFDKSPMFTGRIQGVGPRYCPSIEDKIERFSGKDRHQLFIEPEGLETNSYYVNGFSSSLPLQVQLDALHSIRGFENARIYKPGYAIEYDYFPPTQLSYTLETKLVENLYFAGQINGTTGYEEAASQGLVAGINAALKLKGRPSFVMNRTQSYIGVLIDDLVTKGVDEPYRMFTSRAEYRILLRQDNADVRLTPLSHQFGLASDERLRRVEEKLHFSQQLTACVENTSVLPSEANALLESLDTPAIDLKVKLKNLLLRPQVHINDLLKISAPLSDTLAAVPENLRDECLEYSEVLVKYQNYIYKEQEVANKILKYETVPLKEDFDYFALQSLSYEAREKLSKMRPKTIGQASRISGVSPADISVLIIYLSRGEK